MLGSSMELHGASEPFLVDAALQRLCRGGVQAQWNSSYVHGFVKEEFTWIQKRNHVNR